MADRAAGPAASRASVGSRADALDADLIAAAQSGDEFAFASLYRAIHPRLLRYAFGLIGQDAEDVVAESGCKSSVISDLSAAMETHFVDGPRESFGIEHSTIGGT